MSVYWTFFFGLVSVVCYYNLPMEWILPAESASAEWLKNAPVTPVGGSEEDRTLAGSLWKGTGAVIMTVRRPGCRLCRDEADELSKLKPHLDMFKVPLVGVIHEEVGDEPKDFLEFFRGPLYLDHERRFYGPTERRMLWSGFMRLSTYLRIYETTQKENIHGNLKGDGTLLGGVFVVGPDGAILYEHREGSFGDQCNTTEVLMAVKSFRKK